MDAAGMFASASTYQSSYSRTQVSTVAGFSLSQTHNDSATYTLGTMLRTVRQLGVTRFLPEHLKSSRRLGEGETYLVTRDYLDDVIVAVKHVKLSAVKRDMSFSLAKRLQSVLREVCIMRHEWLAEHANILSVLGYGWIDTSGLPSPFLIVEFGLHGSLRDWLQINRTAMQSSKFHTLRRNLHLCREVASGVLALHQCGIIHGDLKLDNVIVCRKPEEKFGVQVKLSDFGHSIMLDATKDDWKYFGTSLYNAPEVFMQDQRAIHSSRLHQCDIWAYGLLVWEIFLHGAAYFNPIWRKDPKFAASYASDASSAYISETMQSFVLEENKFEVYRHDCFGRFDMRFTGELGVAFMEQIDDPTHILQGAQMVNIIEKTLAYEPSQRASDMSSLKIFNEGYMIPQPPANLATMRPGQLKLSIDMFNCSQVQDFFWDFQQEVYGDIRRLALNPTDDDVAGIAAFQMGLCHIQGFGCSTNSSEAAIWFSKSQQKMHPLAPFVLSQLKLTDADSKDPRVYRRFAATSISASTLSDDDDRNQWESAQDKLKAAETQRITGDLLIQACQEGDIDTVITLLQNGVDLQGSCGTNLFHWLVCIEDHLDLLEQQLRSPTGGAQRYKQKHLVSLVNHVCHETFNIHPQWPLKLSGTPLCFAIMIGSVKCVRFLVKFGATARMQWSGFGDDPRFVATTGVYVAVQHHQHEVLSFLLNRQPWLGSPQRLAQVLSNAFPIEIFFMHGMSSEDALKRTIDVLDYRIPDFFKQHGTACLRQAVVLSNLDVVKALLSRWPRLATQPLMGENTETKFFYPSHYAAYIAGARPSSNAMAIMQTIRQAGASFIQKDGSGRMPLHLAAAGRHCDALRWLLEIDGAFLLINQISTIDWNGRTPVHEVVCREALELLLRYRFDVNKADKQGLTVAHSACISGNQQILSSLIELGAKLNAQDQTGNTPLHYAVYQYWTGHVAMLLAAGVDETLRNINGDTAFQVADTNRGRWLEIATAFRPNVARDRLELERVLALDHKLKQGQAMNEMKMRGYRSSEYEVEERLLSNPMRLPSRPTPNGPRIPLRAFIPAPPRDTPPPLLVDQPEIQNITEPKSALQTLDHLPLLSRRTDWEAFRVELLNAPRVPCIHCFGPVDMFGACQHMTREI